MKTLTTILLICYSIATAQPKAIQKKTPNQIVLDEAHKCMEKEKGIDGGVCEQLIVHCLNKVTTGWRTKYGYGKKRIFSKWWKKHVYGRELGKNETPIPGDIIHLVWMYNDSTIIENHVAIIEQVIEKDHYVVIDQNNGDRVGKNNRVDRWELDTWMFVVKGEVRIFRPY